MRKLTAIISLLLATVLLTLSGCGSSTDHLPELLYDNQFKNGFDLTSQVTLDNSIKTLDYNGAASGIPQWSLAQWGILNSGRQGYNKEDHDLKLGSETYENGFYTYATKSNSKVMKVNPETGELHLSVDSTKEYGQIPRMTGEDWPHLIIGQNFGELIFANDLKNFYMEIEFELLKNQKAAFNKETAQFQWIFTLQNLNPASPATAYKDYLWFNVTLLDDRYDLAPGAGMADGGKEDATGKYIYGPKGEYFMKKKAQVGEKVHVKVDLLPEFKKAFEQAKAADFLKGSNYEDMGFGSMNIGWEVPGLYDIGVKITKLSLKAETKA